MNRSASAGSRLFSMNVISCSAGSLSSTAIFASGNSAPSMISAQSTSSRSGADVEAELRRHRRRDELGAALRRRVVELSPGRVGAEMRLVARLLERRRVVVEPPGQPRVLRVAKIDARVLVAVERVGRERLRVALVLERPVNDVDRPLRDPLAVEAREHPRRAASVKAVAVIQNAETHTAKVAVAPTSGQAGFALRKIRVGSQSDARTCNFSPCPSSSPI